MGSSDQSASELSQLCLVPTMSREMKMMYHPGSLRGTETQETSDQKDSFVWILHFHLYYVFFGFQGD